MCVRCCNLIHCVYIMKMTRLQNQFFVATNKAINLDENSWSMCDTKYGFENLLRARHHTQRIYFINTWYFCVHTRVYIMMEKR